jgi:hypothetical protein
MAGGETESEVWAAIQRNEILSIKLECRGHDRSLRPRPCVSTSGEVADAGILEDGDIEIHGFLGIAVEPQEWSDLLHKKLLSVDHA